MSRGAATHERTVTLVSATGDALAHSASVMLDRARRSADGLALDLSHWLLVVPGARAGRLALRALADEAARRGAPLDPPEIATAGTLVERLFDAPADGLAPATPLERRLAWARAFASAPRDATAALVARGRDPDLEAWWRLATHAVRLEDELAGAGLGFLDLAAATESLGADPARARAFADVESAMLAELRTQGLTTPHEDRRLRLQRGERRRANAALLGVLELGAPQREALAAIDRVEALVVADATRRDLFDDFGAVRDSWADASIPIADELVVSAESAGDQAEAALEFLADAAERSLADGSPLASDEAVVALGDETLGPMLALRARDAGLEIHDAAGTPLLATSVGRALSLLYEWTRTRRPAALAALLRHPAIERHLRDGDRVPRDPLAALDAVRAEKLPSSIGRSDARGSAVQFGESTPHTECVLEAVRALDALLPTDADAAALATAVMALSWDPDDHSALQRALDTIDAVGAVSPVLLEGYDPFGLMLDEASRLRVPGEPRERAVEALGWLELLLEPARAVVVLGMNEGAIPGAPAPDPLLTESLRARVGLPTRRARAARDAAILDVVMRRATSVRFVCGRTAEDGVPLEPSRFVLAADDATLALRVARLFDPRSALADRRAWSRPAAPSSRFVVPHAPAELATLASMRVTAFKDYLESPLRFWLRHVERLEEITDDARELAPPDAGTLVHNVLATAASERLFDRGLDERTLAAELSSRLEGAARRQFGASPVAAVRLQLLAFQPRLARFAAWQALNAAAGWSVRFVERKLPEGTIVRPTPAAERSDAPMAIVGRIDRIDWHAGSRRWRILDFKTSDRGELPRDAHLAGPKTAPRWRDLQLPLYLHGMREALLKLEPESTIELGYVLLPSDETRAGWHDAAFTPAEIDGALRVAADVVGAIRDGAFPPGDRAPKFDPFAVLLQRPVFGRDDDEDEEVAP
ncbi:MAG: PD-(D/E)XK nuclease family protein [Phycisphaerae bacterium]|nr:PD-(D/E)XK nuclease family protein [Phycisphaerae bacterium]